MIVTVPSTVLDIFAAYWYVCSNELIVLPAGPGPSTVTVVSPLKELVLVSPTASFSRDEAFLSDTLLPPVGSVPQAEETRRAGLAPDGAAPGFASAGGVTRGDLGEGGSSTKRREASVVLVDRTLDLAAASSRGGSLLQRVRESEGGRAACD